MSSLVRGAIRPLSIATGHPFHAREPATQTPLIGWNPMARRTDPGGGPTRVTKAERKEQARRERLELMRKQAKRRTRRRIGIVLVQTQHSEVRQSVGDARAVSDLSKDGQALVVPRPRGRKVALGPGHVSQVRK